MKSGIAPLILVIIIGIVLAAGGLGLGLAWKAGLFGKPGGPTDGTTTNGTQPTPPPSDGEEDPTKDWKVYTNTEYGYTIKYPQGWFLGSAENAKEVDIYIHEPPFGFSEWPFRVSISVRENPDGLSAGAYVDKILNTYDLDTRASFEAEGKRTTYIVAGQEAEEVIGLISAYGIIEVFVPRGALMFHLSITPYEAGEPANESAAETFRTMVKTFSFTE